MNGNVFILPPLLLTTPDPGKDYHLPRLSGLIWKIFSGYCAARPQERDADRRFRALVMVILHFQGNLADLPCRSAKVPVVSFPLARRTSIKDLIESFDVPHPEVESLVVNGREVNFQYLVAENDEIEVVPISSRSDFCRPSILRPIPLPELRFVVDVNVAKLAAKLRQLGFDTLFSHGYDDMGLAAIAQSQQRILLTRDCNLLKRKIIEFGHLVRAEQPNEQLIEVIKLFGLKNKRRPYSRCFQCNGLLQPVAKEEILHLLEPLTRKYYDTFHRCADCRKIYWSGSHREHMDEILKEILGAC